MNIALIGSGGREDALCRKLKNSKNIDRIFCIPGNAGTAKIATNLNVNFLDFKLLLKTLKDNKIKIVIVGPEEPLVKGIVNFLEKNKLILVRELSPRKSSIKEAKRLGCNFILDRNGKIKKIM